MFQQWGEPDPTTDCPNPTGFLVNLRTGEQLPAGCRRSTCLPCNRSWSRDLDKVVAYCRPRSLLTITGLPTDPAGINAKLGLLNKYLTRDGLKPGWIWAAELNPAGTGAHVHALSHILPDPDQLSARAQQVGLGRVAHVRPITSAGPMGSYLIKNITHNSNSAASHQALNGVQRLRQASFWRNASGAPTDYRTCRSLAVRPDPDWRFHRPTRLTAAERARLTWAA